MPNKIKLLILTCLFALIACKQETKIANPLAYVLNSENQNIKMVIDSVDQFEVQIRYTQIDRQNDSVIFSDYDFQVNEENYFYPASTIKFPAAVATLEKLNEIDTLNRNIRFYIEGDSVETTFAKAISEIFSVSDNNANNRLVEFLGQDAINQRLKNRGVSPFRLAHRLGYHSDDTTTKPLVIYQNDSTTFNLKPTINSSPKPLTLNKIKKGVGFFEEDSIVSEPFDFSLKNHYPISAQHGLLKRIVFPEKFTQGERFDISEEQREFLLETMHTIPKKIGYDPIEFYDSYCKFFIYGDSKKDIPEHIKIYNKVGWAYGTLTDCAYIKDEKNNIDFMVTATLLVNNNGIFNDDTYEFEGVGIPFLAELGRQLYDYELNRKK